MCLNNGKGIVVLSSNIVGELCNSCLTLFLGNIEAVVGRIRADVFVVSHDSG